MASGLAFALLIVTISTNKHEPGAIGSIKRSIVPRSRIPMNMWVQEQLSPLPTDYAWERFGAEERRVSWDGFLSYDGVLYGLPAEPPVAGFVVQVRERHQQVRVFAKGSLIATLNKRPRSQDIVQHPDQFSKVSPTGSLRKTAQPLGHQVTPPRVEIRDLAEYDQLFSLEATR